MQIFFTFLFLVTPQNAIKYVLTAWAIAPEYSCTGTYIIKRGKNPPSYNIHGLKMKSLKWIKSESNDHK